MHACAIIVVCPPTMEEEEEEVKLKMLLLINKLWSRMRRKREHFSMFWWKHKRPIPECLGVQHIPSPNKLKNAKIEYILTGITKEEEEEKRGKCIIVCVHGIAGHASHEK